MRSVQCIWTISTTATMVSPSSLARVDLARLDQAQTMNASSLVAAGLGPCAGRPWLPEMEIRLNGRAIWPSSDVVGSAEVNFIARTHKCLSPCRGDSQGSKDHYGPMAPIPRRPTLLFVPQARLAT